MLMEVLFELCSSWLSQALACTLRLCPLTSEVHSPFTLPWVRAEQRGPCVQPGPGPSGLWHVGVCCMPGCPRTLHTQGPGRHWLTHVFCVGFLPLLESPSAERWG